MIPPQSPAMDSTRIGVALVAVVAAAAAAIAALFSVLRIVICAETEMHRAPSPDHRTVAIERDDACLTKHATVVVVERAGLPRATLLFATVRRVRGRSSTGARIASCG